MSISLQEKMDWLEQVSRAIAALTKKDDDVTLLREELVQGFHWITMELKKAHSLAAHEFSQWALQNESAFDILFQQEPKTLVEAPEDFILLMQQRIPPKFMHYFFIIANHLYDEKEILKADRVFRLLTLFYPQHAEFWIRLGLCQQKRHLPELALISHTIATVVNNKNPIPHYYMAVCWLQLHAKELAKTHLKECINKIGSDLALLPLKTKCEELEETILSERVLVEHDLLQVMKHKDKVSPSVAINHLYFKTSEEIPFTQLVPGQWKSLLDEMERKTRELENQLNHAKEAFIHKINTLDFFEKHSLIFNDRHVKIPLTGFSHVCTLALGLFFGELMTGMSISSEIKSITGKIQTHHPFRTAYTFATFLDQNEPASKNSLIKYNYVYQNQMDIAFNEEVSSPEYGSSQTPYQENDREDSRIRVSQFLQDDIVGKSILDCGCNEGGILFACRNSGAKAITGFDLNPWCIDQANQVVSTQKIADAKFYVGDMENRPFLSTLPVSDTVLLLAILDTSPFVNKTAVIANLSRLARHTMYYEGHVTQESHVARMYELFIATDFTRFEYLGRFAGRVLIRCSRELMEEKQLPPNAVTSDHSSAVLLQASEIYLFTDSHRNPPFSSKCRLIQFVKR